MIKDLDKMIKDVKEFRQNLIDNYTGGGLGMGVYFDTLYIAKNLEEDLLKYVDLFKECRNYNLENDKQKRFRQLKKRVKEELVKC